MKLVSMHPIVLQWRASVKAQEQILEQAKSLGDSSSEAAALYNLGLLYWQHWQWDKAQHHLKDALAQFRNLSQTQEVINTHALLGHVDYAKGQFTQAEQHYQEAYTLAQQLSNLPAQAQILLALANAYSGCNHEQKALETYETALHSFCRLNDKMGEANTLLNRGHYFYTHNKPDEAYHDYIAAQTAFLSLSIPQYQAYVQQALVNWQARYGRSEDTENHYRQVINLFQQLNNPHGEAQTRLNFAVFLGEQEDNAEAAQQYKKAVLLFQTVEDQPGEANALATWASAPNVPGPPQPGDEMEAIKAKLAALGGRVGPGLTGDPVREERAPISAIATSVQRLVQLVPDTEPILHTLQGKGILQSKSEETGATVAETLLHILTSSRADGLEEEDIYWYVLERLMKPYANTQLINLPFSDGAGNSQTCVSASRIFVLSTQKPGEFARIIEELTTPELAFTITRTYPDDQHYRARKTFLQEGDFTFREVGMRTLAIVVHPDVNALPRALAEHAHRRYPDYSFEKRELKNTRDAVDVLLQAAVTNLALQGRYDSAADADRADGVKGVPYGTYGYLTMDQDILNRIPSEISKSETNNSSRWRKAVVTSPLDAPDAPEI